MINNQFDPHDSHAHRHACPKSKWRAGYLIVGLASLAWLLWRSGAKPSRLAYPCQQVAAATGLGLLAYLASLAGATALYHRARRHLTPTSLALLVAGLGLTAFLHGEVATPATPIWASPTLPDWTSPTAISDVFGVNNVPVPTVSLDGGVIPTGLTPEEALADQGVDALVYLMAAHDTQFYQTAAQPDGIIGPSDVVVIKVSNQWSAGRDDRYQRGHTNIDALKGVLWRIVQHPEGFTGAVVVADNGQDFAVFDNADFNNAEDPRQSYQDVVDAFVGQGYNICISDWDDLRRTFTAEYSDGDTESGYVLVTDGSPGTDQLSYPKFGISCGAQTHQISMRYGLWDGSAYDNSRLKLINFPVLKRHGLAGATSAVKNFMGFVSLADLGRRYGTIQEMHNTFMLQEYGMLGRQLGAIRRPDLNIIDGIWICPSSQNGIGAVRTDVLLGSTDPFALDYYATAHLLVPQITNVTLANDADARYHGGLFRTLLLNNENQARDSGLTSILNLDDNLTTAQEEAQFNVFVADATEVTPPPESLEISAQPSSQTVGPGETTAYTVQLANSISAAVTLTLESQPEGLSATFTPNPVQSPLTQSTLTLTTSETMVAAIYQLVIRAATATLSDTATVNLVVENYSQKLSPHAFSVTLTPNASVTHTLTLSNGGSAALEWGPVAENPAATWLTTTPVSGTLAAGTTTSAALTFDSTGLNGGTYTTTLQMPTNDPEETLVNIPITLRVTQKVYLPIILCQ
jgi:hypothetical protein